MRKIPLRPQAHWTVLRMWSEERLMHGLPVQEFSSTGLHFPWFLSLFILLKLHITCMRTSVHAYRCTCMHTHTQCPYIAMRMTLGMIWLQFSYRGKNAFPHLHIYFGECNFCFSYMDIAICNLNITYGQCALQSKLGKRNE